jgi:hypothetical protein
MCCGQSPYHSSRFPRTTAVASASTNRCDTMTTMTYQAFNGQVKHRISRLARLAFLRALRLLLTAALILAPIAAANAQGEEADRLIREGIALRRQGHNLDALPYFQRAYDIFPTSRASAQLGFVEQSLGMSLEAEKHVSAALFDEGDEWIRKNRTAIVEALTNIRAQLGQLIIETSPPTATISINGRSVVPPRPDSPIYVRPGSNMVEVQYVGFLTQQRALTVLPGTAQRLTIELQKSETAAPGTARIPEAPSYPPAGADPVPGAPHEASDSVIQPGQGKRAGGFILLSFGGLAVAGGVTCLLIANQKIGSIEHDARLGAYYDQRNGNYPVFQRLSQISFATGAAAIVGGGWMLWSGRATEQDVKQPLAVVPRLVASGAPGVGVMGSF